MNGLTKPCDFCGRLITKTLAQQSQRRHWTCGRSCATKLAWRANPEGYKDNPLRGQKETRACAQCGVPVTRYLSRMRLNEVWTCSRSCKATRRVKKEMADGSWHRPINPQKGETNPCETCSAPVYRNASQKAQNHSRFCSKTCADKWKARNSIVKQCAFCGNEFRIPPSRPAIRFCSHRCKGEAAAARPQARTHNGRPVRKDSKGYVLVWEPEHPYKGMAGWVYEHRLIVEQVLGRRLRRDEHVHHINEIKDDNRPENLEPMDGGKHAALSGRDYKAKVAAAFAQNEEYKRRFGPLD